MKSKSYLILIFALLSFVFLPKLMAYCPEPDPRIRTIFTRSDVAFIGTAISERGVDDDGKPVNMSDGDATKLYFVMKVKQLFRGPKMDYIEVCEGNDSGGMGLAVGHTYLIIIHRDPNGDMCGGCRDATEDTEDDYKKRVSEVTAVMENIKRGIEGDIIGYVQEWVVDSGGGGTGDGMAGFHLLLTAKGMRKEIVTGKDGWFHASVPKGHYKLESAEPNYTLEEDIHSLDETNNVEVLSAGGAEFNLIAKKVIAGDQKPSEDNAKLTNEQIVMLAQTPPPSIPTQTISTNASAQPANRSSQQPFFDDFNKIDPSIWSREDWTYPDDACYQQPAQVTVLDSLLTILVERATVPVQGRKCVAGGLYSNRLFGHGRFTARLRNQLVPGMDSGFFIMSPWQAKGWRHQEVDFEFLGKNPSQVQLNVHKYIDHEGTPENGGQLPKLIDLGFDSTKAFHAYCVEWLKDRLNFYVDGKLVRSESRNLPDQELNLRLESFIVNQDNGWGPGWAGTFDPKTLPASVQYDWVKYEPEP
jgi:endo-1,3-1,4-beta-glycanase ExoK